MVSHHAPRRAGLSLIEVCVVVFVVGILISLLLPAVQSAREAARLAACVNHLKQIGVALEHHVSRSHAYPPGIRPDDSSLPGRPRAVSPLSVQTELLPYLEQAVLYHSMNFTGSMLASDARNETAVHQRVSTFLCPSDTFRLWPGNHYLANVGPFPWEFDSKTPPGGGGAFVGFTSLRPNDFRDGLSATVGFSERLEGSAGEQFSKKQDFWFTGISKIMNISTSDEMASACSSLTGMPSDYWTRSGQSWSLGRYSDTLYNHVMVPNSRISDCSADPPFGTPGDISGGAITARSNHRNGVNALFMDGSVRFVKDGIQLGLWRALATRSGGEAASWE